MELVEHLHQNALRETRINRNIFRAAGIVLATLFVIVNVKEIASGNTDLGLVLVDTALLAGGATLIPPSVESNRRYNQARNAALGIAQTNDGQ